MTDKKPIYANFPERGLKVQIGPHINATNTKLLRKLTIGTYEMSIKQQEKIGGTVENARLALSGLARERSLRFEVVESRDCAGAFRAEADTQRIQVWVTTPFDGSQTNHLVWAKVSDPSQARRIGVAFKFSTSFTTDDIVNTVKKAEEAIADLEAEAPVVIQGNPPPRFKKKTEKTEEKAESANEGGSAPTDPATPPAAGDPGGGD